MVHITKGELTQEEKELLEVIGKGMGAGLRPGAACLVWGSGGALEAPLAGLTLRCFSARLAASHRFEIAFLSMVSDRLRGRRGAEREALLGLQLRLQRSVSQISCWKHTRFQAPAHIVMSDLGVWVPGCTFFKTQGDFDHRQSGQQWPQVLRTVSKGPFRLPEAERSGSFSCPRPRLGGGGSS